MNRTKNKNSFSHIENNIRYIKMRPLVQEDVQNLFKWHNDYDVTKYSMTLLVFPQTIEDCSKFVVNQNSNKMITMGIVFKKNLVGYAGISRIDWINRSGEFFIFLGNKKKWGLGIGYIASKFVLNFGFKSLGLNRIDLTVSDLNIKAINLYKRLNFIKEGIKRKACFRDGKYHNKILMAILSEKWFDK